MCRSSSCHPPLFSYFPLNIQAWILTMLLKHWELDLQKMERKTCFPEDADPSLLPAIQKGNKLLSVWVIFLLTQMMYPLHLYQSHLNLSNRFWLSLTTSLCQNKCYALSVITEHLRKKLMSLKLSLKEGQLTAELKRNFKKITLSEWVHAPGYCKIHMESFTLMTFYAMSVYQQTYEKCRSSKGSGYIF